MPLLCISLLALLLPLSLSCDSTHLNEIRSNYMAIIQTDLLSTSEQITVLLQNTSCSHPKYKLPSCESGSTQSIVNNLHTLTCKMRTLGIPDTCGLITSVLDSLRCPCSEKPTKEPNGTARRQRRYEQRKIKPKKLCKANTILSHMTQCYQKLNSLQMDT